MSKLVALSGDPKPGSYTNSLAHAFLQAAEHQASHTHLINLSSIASTLGAASSLLELSDDAAEAYQHLLDADILVLIAPVYGSSFPGLFKHFFDLLDVTALRGKITLLASTGPSLYSSLLDLHLRPLADYFGLYSLTIDNYLPHQLFTMLPGQNYLLHDEQALARIRFSIAQAISLSGSQKYSLV